MQNSFRYRLSAVAAIGLAALAPGALLALPQREGVSGLSPSNPGAIVAPAESREVPACLGKNNLTGTAKPCAVPDGPGAGHQGGPHDVAQGHALGKSEALYPGALSPVAVPANEPARGDALVPPDLAALIDEALKKNPRIIAAVERLEAGRVRARSAGSFEEPSAGVSYQNDGLSSFTLGSSEDSQIALSYSQPLPGPGKRALRREWARRSADAGEPAVRRAEMDVRLDLIRAWWSLGYELQARAILEEQKDLVDRVEALVRSRYSLGQGIQQDVLRAQVERTRLAEALAFSRERIEALRAELHGHLVLGAEEPLPDPGPLPELPEPLDARTGVDDALRRSPEIQALERAGGAAEARLAVARSDYRPDYTLGGSYMYRGSLYRGSFDPMVAVSLAIRLPVFRRNRLDPDLAAAASDASAVRADAETLRILVETRVRQRVHAILAARESVRLIREGVIPQDRLALESVLAAYRTGRVEFTSVLASLSAVLDDRLDLERRLASAAREQAALEAVSLEPPESLSFSMGSGAGARASAAMAPSVRGPSSTMGGPGGATPRAEPPIPPSSVGTSMRGMP